jgi:hypothetical protein
VPELERSLIAERVRAGVRHARAKVSAWAGQPNALTPPKLPPFALKASRGGALGKCWACLLPLPWPPVSGVYKWSVFQGWQVVDLAGQIGGSLNQLNQSLTVL